MRRGGGGKGARRVGKAVRGGGTLSNAERRTLNDEL